MLIQLPGACNQGKQKLFFWGASKKGGLGQLIKIDWETDSPAIVHLRLTMAFVFP